MIALALQVAAAFNLVCAGHYKVELKALSSINMTEGTPFAITYRIDLERGRFCTNDCASTEALANVTETEIVFRGDPVRQDDATGNDTRVNRETGAYASTITLSDEIVLFDGTCRRAPFTGFPPGGF